MLCVRYSYIYNKYSWTDCIEWMEEDRYWMVALRYHPTGRGNLGRPREKRQMKQDRLKVQVLTGRIKIR